MRLWAMLVLAAGILTAATAARAIMSGEESTVGASEDTDYAVGKAAFQSGDWKAAIDALQKVVTRRPWHDNAYNMLGYAYRQSGDYTTAFAMYDKALALNPRHRGALEYMGVAYLDLGRIEEAQAVALRLGEVCALVVMAFDNTGWKSGCEELNVLTEAFRARGVPLPNPKS